MMNHSLSKVCGLICVCALTATGCGDDGDEAVEYTVNGTVTGLVGGEAIEGAQVCILEYASREDGGCAQTGADGSYVLSNLEGNIPLTLHVALDGYVSVRATIEADADRLGNVTLVTPEQLDLQALLLGTSIDRSLAGIGLNIDDVTTAEASGVAGATATLTPANGDGPYYVNSDSVPDASQSETSENALISWANVPAGDYTLDVTVPGHDCTVFYGTAVGSATQVAISTADGEITLAELQCTAQ